MMIESLSRIFYHHKVAEIKKEIFKDIM